MVYIVGFTTLMGTVSPINRAMTIPFYDIPATLA